MVSWHSSYKNRSSTSTNDTWLHRKHNAYSGNVCSLSLNENKPWDCILLNLTQNKKWNFFLNPINLMSTFVIKYPLFDFPMDSITISIYCHFVSKLKNCLDKKSNIVESNHRSMIFYYFSFWYIWNKLQRMKIRKKFV